MIGRRPRLPDTMGKELNSFTTFKGFSDAMKQTRDVFTRFGKSATEISGVFKGSAQEQRNSGYGAFMSALKDMKGRIGGNEGRVVNQLINTASRSIDSGGGANINGKELAGIINDLKTGLMSIVGSVHGDKGKHLSRMISGLDDAGDAVKSGGFKAISGGQKDMVKSAFGFSSFKMIQDACGMVSNELKKTATTLSDPGLKAAIQNIKTGLDAAAAAANSSSDKLKALGDAKKDIENLIKHSSGLDKGMMQALRLNLVRINNELKKANSGQMMQKFGQMIAKPFVGAAQTLGKGLAVLGAVKRTFDVTNGVFQAINGKINQFARMQMSITAERAGYGRQLRGAGMNFGEMMGALAAGRSAGMEDKAVVNQMVGLQTELSKARWGEGSMIESAGRWGISTFNSDGSVRTANEMMVQFSRKLRSLGDDMEKLQFLTHIGFSPDKMEYVQNYEKEAEHAKMVRENPHMQTLMDRANILDESGYNARVDKYTKIEQRRREILNQNAIDKGLWSGLERSFNPENWFFNDWTAREKGVRGANAEIANEKMTKLLEAMLKEMEKNGGDRKSAMESAMSSPEFSVDTLTGLVDALKLKADEKNDPSMVRDFEAAFKNATGITLDTRTNVEKMCERLNELCKGLVKAFEDIAKRISNILGGKGSPKTSIGTGIATTIGVGGLGALLTKGGRALSRRGGVGSKVAGWGTKGLGRFLSRNKGKLGLLAGAAMLLGLAGDDDEEGENLADMEEYATGGRYPRKGGVTTVDANGPLAKYARGGRSAKRAIFGEAGPEYAIPVEHSKNTADLLNQASQESGFGNPRIGKGDVVPEYANGGRYPERQADPNWNREQRRMYSDIAGGSYWSLPWNQQDSKGYIKGTDIRWWDDTKTGIPRQSAYENHLRPEDKPIYEAALEEKNRRRRAFYGDLLTQEPHFVGMSPAEKDMLFRGFMSTRHADFSPYKTESLNGLSGKEAEAVYKRNEESRRAWEASVSKKEVDAYYRGRSVGSRFITPYDNETHGGAGTTKFQKAVSEARESEIKERERKERIKQAELDRRRKKNEEEERRRAHNDRWELHAKAAFYDFVGTTAGNIIGGVMSPANLIPGVDVPSGREIRAGWLKNSADAGVRRRIKEAEEDSPNWQYVKHGGGSLVSLAASIPAFGALFKSIGAGVNAIRGGKAVGTATEAASSAGGNASGVFQKAAQWFTKHSETILESGAAATTVAMSAKEEAAKQKAVEQKKKEEEEAKRNRRKVLSEMKDEDFLDLVRTKIASKAPDKEIQEMFTDRGLWSANANIFRDSKAFMGDGKKGDNVLGAQILGGMWLAQENAEASLLAGKGVNVNNELANLKDKYAIAWKDSGRGFDQRDQRIAIAARQAGNKDATTFPEMKHYFEEGDKYGEKQVALLAKIAADLAKKEENKGLSPNQIREKAEGERRKQFLKDMTAEDLRNRFKYNYDGSIITDEKEIAKRRDEAFKKEGVEVGMSQKFKSEQKEALDAFIKQNPKMSLGANLHAFATKNKMRWNDVAELLGVDKKFEDMTAEEQEEYKQTRAYRKESAKQKRETNKKNREKEWGERADKATDEEIASVLKGPGSKGLMEYYKTLRDKVNNGETLSEEEQKKYDETRTRIGRSLSLGFGRPGGGAVPGGRYDVYGQDRRPQSTRRQDSKEYQRIMDEWQTKRALLGMDDDEKPEPSMWGKRLLDKREQEANEAAAKEEAEKKGGRGRRGSTPAPRRSGRSSRLPAFSLTGGRGISITGGKGLSSLTGGKGISITGGKGLSKLSELGNSYEPESGGGSLSSTSVKARQAEAAAESGNKAAAAVGGGQGAKTGSDGATSVSAPITVYVTVQGNLDEGAVQKLERELPKIVKHTLNDSAVSVIRKIATR